MSGASLTVPGLLHVGTSGEHELAVLHAGPWVGWVALKGIRTWSREVSVVLKADVRGPILTELGVMLPEGRPEMARLSNVQRAARASDLVAVDSSLVDTLVAKGVRVHTIGSDRITGGFYYFAKGGPGEAVRLQGNLVEMVASALAASADNAAIEACLDGVVARVLAELSRGVLSEAQVELAAALPALGEPAPEAVAKLQTLEGFLVNTGTRASRYEERARAVLDALERAARQGEGSTQVPLFGEASRVVQPELEVEYAEGESGTRRKLKLPESTRWLVAGLIAETIPPPAVTPDVAEENAATAKAAAEKAAAEKAAAEKAAAEKAAAEKAAAEKAAAAKKAAEKAAAEKAAAEKAAAAKKAAEKAAAEKAAAEKAATEKAAAEKAATEKAAAEKAATEKAAAEKAAAEKAATEKAAAEKATAEKAAAEKAAAEKAATEKAAAEKAAAKKATKKAYADKAAAEKAAAKAVRKAAADKPAASERPKPAAAALTKSDEPKSVPARAESKRTPAWIWLVVVLAAAVGAYYFAFMRGGH